MARLRRRGRDGLILFATAFLFVSCKEGILDPGLTPDACMDGEFVYRPEVCVPEEPDRTCELRFLMGHSGSLIHVTGVETDAEAAPWDSLRFEGGVVAIGEARGTLTADFGDDPVTIESVVVSLSDVGGCPDRLTIGPFGYTAPDGRVVPAENYTAERTVACARRRPACELSP